MLTKEKREALTELMKKANSLDDERQKILAYVAIGMDLSKDTMPGPEKESA